MKRPVLKISYNAPVTLTFALLCLLALALNGLTGGWTTSHLFSVYRCSLADPLAFVRFFGHVLGHANLSHLVGNLGLMLVLGAGLEDRYGSFSVFWAIVFTALVSGLIHFVFFPGTALLGASGVVFMMILLSAFGGMKSGPIPPDPDLCLSLLSGRRTVGRHFRPGRRLPADPYHRRSVRHPDRILAGQPAPLTHPAKTNRPPAACGSGRSLSAET